MERKDYEKIIKKHYSFEVKNELKDKQLSNILKYIATDIKEDDIIGFADAGLVKNGKSGELITKDAFYVSLRKAKIPFAGLENITYKKKGSVKIDATFHYVNGKTMSYELIFGKPELLVEILLEIAKQYNAVEEKVVPQKLVVMEEKKMDKTEPKVVEKTGKDWILTGYNYYIGQGVRINWEKSYECFVKAAELGEASAYFYLSEHYKLGKGVEKNVGNAYRMLAKGAELGDARAMDMLIEETACGTYLPSKEMLMKMQEYGKRVLAGDSYFEPFLAKIDEMLEPDESIKKEELFTMEDLLNGLTCNICGTTLLPTPGTKETYCVGCCAMRTAKDLKATGNIVTSNSLKTVEPYRLSIDELVEEAENAILYDDNYELALEKYRSLVQQGLVEYSLQVATCYVCLGKDKEAMEWAAKCDLEKMDAEEHAFSAYIIGDMYLQNECLEDAKRFADFAYKGGDKDAAELLGEIQEVLKKAEPVKKEESGDDMFAKVQMICDMSQKDCDLTAEEFSYWQGLAKHFSEKGFINEDVYSAWVYRTRQYQSGIELYRITKKWKNDEIILYAIYYAIILYYEQCLEPGYHEGFLEPVTKESDKYMKCTELEGFVQGELYAIIAEDLYQEGIAAINNKSYIEAYRFLEEAYDAYKVYADNKWGIYEVKNMGKEASKLIARMYKNGLLYSDPKTEEHWYQVAANNGDADSAYRMYQLWSKRGVPSEEWLEKAAQLGHRDAKKEWEEYQCEKKKEQHEKLKRQREKQKLVIDTMECIACEQCIDICPRGAISPGIEAPVINQSKCDKCGACMHMCPIDAIRWE